MPAFAGMTHFHFPEGEEFQPSLNGTVS